MVLISTCALCKHQRENIDGWIPCCDAFTDGKPYEYELKKIEEKKVCNNGIGYEKK